MVEGIATIQNDAGIHVRPSGVIYHAVSSYSDTVEIRHKDFTCDFSNVMCLIAMGLKKGDVITMRISGTHESELLTELTTLFESNFDYVNSKSIPDS